MSSPQPPSSFAPSNPSNSSNSLPPPLPQNWASSAPNISKSKPLRGASLVQKLILSLSSPPPPSTLLCLELSAVSISYLEDQFLAHIPYKLNVMPTEERLIEIAGLNDDKLSTEPPSKVNLFGKKANKYVKEIPANGLIESDVDPLEFVTALLELYGLLVKVKHLRVTGRHWPQHNEEGEEGGRDPTVDLSLFPELAILEIEGVPVENVRNLEGAKKKLRLMKIERACVYDIDLITGTEGWEELSHLKLSVCCVGELSGLQTRGGDGKYPISRISELQSLNLSRNQILKHSTALKGLTELRKLNKVDLSFNFISSMEGAYMMLGNIKTLVLSGNRLRKTEGLERLYSLEVLMLDRNEIEDFTSITNIGSLPCLNELTLARNPMCSIDGGYRVSVLNLFREKRGEVDLNEEGASNTSLQSLLLPLIDKVPATRKELMQLRDLTFASVVSSEPVNPPAISVDESVSSLMTDDSGWRHTIGSGGDVDLEKKRKKKKKHKNAAQIEDRASMSSVVSLSADRGERDESGEASFSTMSVNIAPTDPMNLQERAGTGGAEDVEKKEEDVGSAAANRRAARAQRRSRMATKMEDLKATISNLENGEVVEEESPGEVEDSVDISTNSSVYFSPAKTDTSVNTSVNTLNTTVDTDADASGLIVVKAGELKLEDGGGKNIIEVKKVATVTADEVGTGDVIKVEPEPVKKKKKKKKRKASLRPPLTPNYNSDNAVTMESPGMDEIGEGGETISPKPRKDSGDAFLDEFWGVGERKSSNPTLFVVGEGGWTVGERGEGEYPGGKETESQEGDYVADFQLKNMLIEENLSLYFREQVFSDKRVLPYLSIGDDGAAEVEEAGGGEKFISLWCEDILPCGPKAREKLGEKEGPNRGFHGEVKEGKESSAREGTNCVICVSDKAFYIVLKDENLSGKFSDAPRPSCLARHPLENVSRCSIGFFFQRLVISFLGSGGLEGCVYNVLTSSKLVCYDILKVLTPLANEVRSAGGGKVKIDNDDKSWLNNFHGVARGISVNVVMYRIVRQQWKSGNREPVRRALVITDTHVFLIDESYVGDGSELGGRGAGNGGGGGVEEGCGDVKLSMVDVDLLKNVTEVRPADEDPKQITLVFKQKSVVQRSHKWRIVCRDGLNAEKIVEAVRQGIG
ncbi:hypothetical protein TrST_g10450 [Triparma strigata]|uniref:Uncharacterized protein n=1 Tax=Triparma strigata TaxID=1606541 RepID=A0A9W7F357_9STRA|nr:hypothetical protein TrST_g10450 [Triparma strigata]